MQWSLTFIFSQYLTFCILDSDPLKDARTDQAQRKVIKRIHTQSSNMSTSTVALSTKCIISTHPFKTSFTLQWFLELECQCCSQLLQLLYWLCITQKNSCYIMFIKDHLTIIHRYMMMFCSLLKRLLYINLSLVTGCYPLQSCSRVMKISYYR